VRRSVAADDRHVVFVGVDPGGSSALAAVPRWSRLLGVPLAIRAVDVPLGAPREAYVQVFDELAQAPAAAGAVITAHKVAMYAAVADRCRSVTPDARRLRECNVLARRPAGVAAYATDVRSIGAAVDRIWPPGPAAGGEGSAERPDRAGDGGRVLCLGAGGSAAALCLHLLRRARPPRRIDVCERQPERAAALGELFGADAIPDGVDLRIHSGADRWDRAVAALPPGSLVVNATGLGKTSPASPLSPGAVLPPRSTVWDLNYRGPLPFLAQARAQARSPERGLAVHDGSHLFALGWLAALSALLGIDTAGDQDIEREFVAVAAEVRATGEGRAVRAVRERP
jgi:shikimate dehydrogenase